MDFRIYDAVWRAATMLHDEGGAADESGNTSILIVFVIIFVLAAAMLWVSKNWNKVKVWLGFVAAVLGVMLPRSKKSDETAVRDIDEIIAHAGYAYDTKQGIFYSRMDAWQRVFGYCRLYDEASAPLGMIIDCEPITFDYDGKSWMIEFWKGQYDFTTGCEVGVYTAARDVRISGFHGTFYDCASDEDMQKITLSLRKNGKTLFKRRGRHWWLTGFVLGEFSEPEELSMRIRLSLKDRPMADAFVQGLYRAGYTTNEIAQSGSTVSLVFYEPRTPQPVTSTPHVAYVAQWKNKFFCDRYKQITRSYDTMPEKLAAMREKAPEMFEIMMNIGRRKDVFASFEMIRGAL